METAKFIKTESTLSKCSFCGEKAPTIKQPKGWLILDMNRFGYTNLQACEQCARFVMIGHLLSQLSKPHTKTDVSFLQSYFPDLKKLEDVNE